MKDEILKDDIPCGKVLDSGFRPPWWARNRHVQTIWPRFFQRRQAFAYQPERLKLPDGDFVDLAWGERPPKAKGLAVVFHGLEGSVRSHYANDTLVQLQRAGWWPVLMHFRGCSGEPNHTPRAYHSGETEDAWYLMNILEQRFPELDKVAIGFSLGGNMLLKLLGERPQQGIIKKAMVVSAPLNLATCSDSINQGFSRLYQWYLLKSMVKTLSLKLALQDFASRLTISPKALPGLRSFRQFDQHVTAPLHGFAGADDYYTRCSGRQFLRYIATPTLILHAQDDPFMHPSVIPDAGELSADVSLEVSPRGGHVGFMQGTPWRPVIWYLRRLTEFLNTPQVAR